MYVLAVGNNEVMADEIKAFAIEAGEEAAAMS